MSRFKSCVITITLLLLVAATAPAQPRSPLAKMELNEGDTLVFLGDSITHQCLYTQYVEDYFYTRFPHVRIRFHNAGVGGDRAADALIRFDQDVASYRPKYVTVLLGMNDGTYRPYDEATFQTYRKGMKLLMQRIQKAGATPILMTPTMYDSRAARVRRPDSPTERLQLYNSVLAYYGAWLREQAVDSGYGFVDMYSPLNNLTLAARKGDASFTLIPDAVHPAAPGQLVMAYSLLFDMGLPRVVSNVRISRGAEGQAEVRAAGGEVSDAGFTDRGLGFTLAANSLPLAVLPDAREGAELLHLGHRLSREAIEVHGLAPGRYRLTIDGKPVGEYSAAQLERHIELQENDQTPQYGQALKVAQFNGTRNQQAVRPLRNLWSQQKRLRRSKAQLKENPDNANLQASVKKLRAALSGFDEQITSLEAKAREIEDEIYRVNQPVSRRYRLERIGS